jgi:ribose transport system permease protein
MSAATRTPPVPAIGSRSGRRGRRPLRFYMEAYALVGCLVAVAIFFSLYADTAATFPTTGNLKTLLGNQAVLGIVTLAVLVPLVCGQFDLSVGAVTGLVSIVVAETMSSGTPVLLTMAIGVGIGLAVGTINGLLVTVLGVNSVIATLGAATLCAGVVAQESGGVSIAGNIPESVFQFGSGQTLGIPNVAFVLLAVALAVYYLLDHTPLGRYVYALGSNVEAARLVGLRTDRVLASSFVVAGVLAGIAGVLQVARTGGADPRLGENFTLAAFAAAFLSAASVNPGRFNVGGAMVGIFFLAVLNSGLSLAGAPDYVDHYVNGLALIIGVAVAVFLGRRRVAAATKRR